MQIKNYFMAKGLAYALAIGLGISSIIGCSKREEREELSDIIHEGANVSETVYMPSRHGSGSGMGPTMDFDGNVGVAITSVNVDIPEKYAVVFKCKHGKFISEGKDQRHKDLWQKLSQGDSVDVTYKEVFRTIYDDANDDGKLEIISRDLVDFDFIDAEVIKRK